MKICQQNNIAEIFFTWQAFPEELTTTIVDENGIEIELKWLKTNQFLANEHLPIWRAQTQTRLHQDTQVRLPNTDIKRMFIKFNIEKIMIIEIL